jgi:hypothetical protein
MKNGFPDKFIEAVKDLGVELDFDPDAHIDASCPFSLYLGIRWPNVLVVEDDPAAFRDDDTIGHAIHEMGHIICTRNVDDPEEDFFGWEFAVAVKYDLLGEWLGSSRDYSLRKGAHGFSEFGTLTEDEQSEALEYYSHRAEVMRYVVGGDPIAYRPVVRA